MLSVFVSRYGSAVQTRALNRVLEHVLSCAELLLMFHINISMYLSQAN